MNNTLGAHLNLPEQLNCNNTANTYPYDIYTFCTYVITKFDILCSVTHNFPYYIVNSKAVRNTFCVTLEIKSFQFNSVLTLEFQ